MQRHPVTPPRPRRSVSGAHRRMAPVLVAAVLAMSLAGGLAGCGSSSSSSSTHVHFAKTKFLFHAGLAFGAFHRYVYDPYKAGGFTPASSHKVAIVKAGVAGLFAYHELKIALVDAQSSATLSKLVSPITALETKLHSLGTGLHSGKLDGAGISSANSAVSSLGSKSAGSGASIKDLATSSLS
jgi:hypothetical protein